MGKLNLEYDEDFKLDDDFTGYYRKDSNKLMLVAMLPNYPTYRNINNMCGFCNQNLHTKYFQNKHGFGYFCNACVKLIKRAKNIKVI